MKKLLQLLALATLATTGTAAAQDCSSTITGNDQIQYSQQEIVVDAQCDEFTLTLEHTGMLPVMQMGHNWVLTRTEHWEEIAQTGQGAGLENDYLPADEERIIVSTAMIGGGEQTSITFDVSALDPDEDYTFFCSFPGHFALMNGEFILSS
ncbi:MAG: azurin [Pseudohongiellaceae bacterium]